MQLPEKSASSARYFLTILGSYLGTKMVEWGYIGTGTEADFTTNFVGFCVALMTFGPWIYHLLFSPSQKAMEIARVVDAEVPKGVPVLKLELPKGIDDVPVAQKAV